MKMFVHDNITDTNLPTALFIRLATTLPRRLSRTANVCTRDRGSTVASEAFALMAFLGSGPITLVVDSQCSVLSLVCDEIRVTPHTRKSLPRNHSLVNTATHPGRNSLTSTIGVNDHHCSAPFAFCLTQALHYATQRGQLATMSALIEAGADLMSQRSRLELSDTALHIAVQHNHPTAVMLLLRAGAEVSPVPVFL